MENVAKFVKPDKFNAQNVKPNSKTLSLLKDFGNSLVYSGLQEPVNGLVQLIDKTTGTELDKHLQFITQPQSAKFGTASWYASQSGQALGMLLPLMLTSGVVKYGLGSGSQFLAEDVTVGNLAKDSLINTNLDKTALEFSKTEDLSLKLNSSEFASKALMPINQDTFGFAKANSIGLTLSKLAVDPGANSALGLSLKESALTGFTYGAVLTPGQSHNKQNLTDFLGQRLESGLSSSLMFSTMTASSLALSSLAKTAALESTVMGKVFTNNLSNSVLASLPGSILGTETNAYFNTGKLASSQDLFQQAYTMGLFSLGFGIMGETKAKIQDYHSKINSLINIKPAQNDLQAFWPNAEQAYPNAIRPPIYPIDPTFAKEVFAQAPQLSDFNEVAHVLIDGKLPQSDKLLNSSGNSAEYQARSMISFNDGKLTFTNKFNKPVYIKPDGSTGFNIALTPNRSLEITPNSELHLENPDGPKIDLFKSQVTNIPEVFFNGRPINLTDGSASIGSKLFPKGESDLLDKTISHEHGKITYDHNYNQFIYTDSSTNGTYIKNQNNEWLKLNKGDSKIVSPSDEIHLASEDGPLLRLKIVNGYKLENGNIVYNRQNNNLIFSQTGNSKFEDIAQTGYFANAQGQIIKAFGPNDFSLNYEISPQNTLQKVTINHNNNYTMELTSPDNYRWQIKYFDKDGNPKFEPKEWKGYISLGNDGSLILNSKPGLRIIHGTDGSKEYLFANGYSSAISSNLASETSILKALGDHYFGDTARRDRLILLKDNALKTMRKNGLNDINIANTIHHINRMLRAGSESYLDKNIRGKLAEQILLNTAFPHTIDQGGNNTCNVTTVEARVYTKSPQYAAKLIADTAINGKVISPTGKVIDVARSKGLRPDQESLAVLNHQFDPSLFKDIKLDGYRNFANQIFQIAAVNLHYSEASLPELKALDPNAQGLIQYIKDKPVPGDPGDTGERLMLYYLNNNQVLDQQLRTQPAINTVQLADIYNLIVPHLDADGYVNKGIDKGFVLIGPKYFGTYIKDIQAGKILAARTPEDFTTTLKNYKGNFPIILLVDANSNESLFGPSRTSHSTHVILIDNIIEDMATNPPSLKVEVTNQWGIKFNRIGDKAISANELFKSVI